MTGRAASDFDNRDREDKAHARAARPRAWRVHPRFYRRGGNMSKFDRFMGWFLALLLFAVVCVQFGIAHGRQLEAEENG